MQADVALQVIGAVLGAAGIGSVITAIMNRRKLGAEATEILTKAAGGVVERLEAENVRLNKERLSDRARIEELERRDQLHEQNLRRIRETLQVHAAFDFMAIRRLQEMGQDVGNAPPLMPDFLMGA